jgi:predicted nucleotidyltransferase
MNLEPDFKDFVELLNKRQVEYMVVGGYALAFHGEPRFTGDIDIWIDCTDENAQKMVVVMADFGAASLGFTKEDFLDKNIIKQIGQPPLRIDILGKIDGVRYKDAVRNKQQFKSENLSIPFIGVKDFIRNKEAAGRKKDLKDVKKIKPKLIEKKVKSKNSKGESKGLN